VNSLFGSSKNLAINVLSREEYLGLHLMSKAVVGIMFTPFLLPVVLCRMSNARMRISFCL